MFINFVHWTKLKYGTNEIFNILIMLITSFESIKYDFVQSIIMWFNPQKYKLKSLNFFQLKLKIHFSGLSDFFVQYVPNHFTTKPKSIKFK